MYTMSSKLLKMFKNMFALWVSALGLMTVMSAVPAFSSPWQYLMTLDGKPSGFSMFMPSALYVDQERERYYVVDSGNNRLLSFDKDGNFLKSFNAQGKLSIPVDMIRGKGAVMWVIERGKNSITRIDLKAKEIVPQIITYKGKAVYPDRFTENEGLFYVIDKVTGSILCLDKDLQIKKVFSCPDCRGGLVDFVIREESLWALGQLEQVIYRFSLDEAVLQEEIFLDRELNFPCAMTMDTLGNFFILDRHGGCVAVFDGHGRFKYQFLRPGEAQGRLHFPQEIRFDPWGRLCIVEEGNGRVEVFSR